MTTPANPDDLTAFVHQQLDDDERIARSATPGPWRTQNLPYVEGDDDADIIAADGRWVAGLTYDGLSTTTAHEVDEDGAHIARHDPARVLAEVDAKRRILDLHVPWQSGYMWVDADTRVPDLRCSVCHDIPADVDYDNPAYAVEFPCPTLRLLALPYADRPGYREEWRPA